MKDLNTVEYYPTLEKLVEILMKKTQSNSPLFFRVLVSYYFAKVASMMRATIGTHDRGKIPVNLYAINLANSGVGKGHSTNIVEEQVIHLFRERFLEETFPVLSEENLIKLANKRALKKGEDPEEELVLVQKEFKMLGTLAFSFDSGTTAAVKQMRHKLLMANAGSMNMEIDEIGSNLLGNVDVLTTFLELYDIGKVKQKLIKNTAENTRSEEIDGRTPTNMMWFGTPTKLFDGGRTEEAMYSLLDTGYARRCLFGYAAPSDKDNTLTPQQIYDMMTDNASEAFLQVLANKLGNLADIVNFDLTIDVPKDVTLLFIEYKLKCESIARKLGEHEEVKKAELSHRYFKALKLAGTYAFIEGSSEITEELAYNAIKLVEESGKAFENILTRDRNYVKLAKYIADINKEVTHVDLVEDLPFYRGSESQKKELMTLAIAYGYKNNIIIKRQFNDGIEFLKGESLQETDLNKIVVSYSTKLADEYKNELVKFVDLPKLTQLPNYHWTSHHMKDNYRNEENAINGFNLVVIDVDNGTSIDTAKLLLENYTYLIYSTKRSKPTKNRFRLILPISHTLKLDASDYGEFMENIYEWLPFAVDEQTNQRARKWMTHDGDFHLNQGKLLDALSFIPKTSKNEIRKQTIVDQQSLSNLERWFISNTGEGNRSNQLIKFALLLVDSGMNIENIKHAVLALNDKLPDKLTETEVLSTILVTASKALHKRDNES